MLYDHCVENIIKKDTLFILPSYMEYYYRVAHRDYSGLPLYDPHCRPNEISFKIIYPQEGLKIFLPKESLDKKNELFAKAYHHDKKAILYWFVDDQFIKKTTDVLDHDCRITLRKGYHILTVTDQWGNREQVEFEILESE